MVIEELELPGDDERDDSVCEALGVAHKSLFYNKLDTSRVDETITLKIAYYLISNDLSATPKLNARLSPENLCPEKNRNLRPET